MSAPSSSCSLMAAVAAKEEVPNLIKFPGLGLEFNIKETAFPLFGLDIKWYGIIITTGIMLAFLLFYYLGTKKEMIDPDTIYNVVLMVLPISIIGARFFYVVTTWETDFKGTGFLNIINIRNGGIAIYGAIIFGLATVLIYNKIRRTSSLSMLDALAPAVMVGQIIGRWGNFVNAEAYGVSDGIEKFPWRMWLETVRIDGILQKDMHLVHPTFLYESLWNLLGLVLILTLLYRKKKFDGEIFFAYIGWYGLGRSYIETLRADSLYLVGSLRFSVVVGISCVIAAVIGLIVLSKKYKEEALEMTEYKSEFETVRLAMNKMNDSLNTDVFNTNYNDEAEENEETEAEAEEDEVLEGLEESADSDEETLKEQAMLEGDATEEDEENDKSEE